MSSTTLMIHPEETRISRLVGSWLREFKKNYKKQNLPSARKFLSISGVNSKKLNRSYIEKALIASEPCSVDKVVYYGHATRCSLSVIGPGFEKPNTEECDQCNECKKLPTEKVLLDIKSLKHLDGKEIYVVACKSAKKLGDDIIDFCTRDTAFFGYFDRIDLPRHLSNDIKDRFKNIVNSALEILHRHNGFNSKLDRYRAVANAILEGFAELADEVRSTNPPDLVIGDEVYAVQWRMSFRPACKINGQKYTIENFF